jgi:hypothetical protein
LIRPGPASADLGMKAIVRNLARTLGALALAGVTLVGIHRH